MITLKIESSEILTDSEGENDSNPLKNSIKVFPRALRKTNYVEHEYYEIRQVSDTQFEILGSPLSRAIDNQMEGQYFVQLLDCGGLGQCFTEEEVEVLYKTLCRKSIYQN